jgi:ABC-type transport system involved in cytochrome bd biosynthesis fused ATPase/permease subunit
MAGKPIRLGKAAGELNVGISTLIDFLHSKGIKIDTNPNTKLEPEHYDILQKEFAADQNLKEQSKFSTVKRERRETISIRDSKSDAPEATEEDIQSALDKASCESLLKRTDNGINSVIGEGGLKLSGGEKQRISIARALLRNPRLLLFDEATSALDSITEEDITATIREISARKEQITLLIAHRLSTIMHADRIYVLEKGVIVETGSHEELLAEKGLYYAMWRQQIGERA